jgi:hypothetical protein
MTVELPTSSTMEQVSEVSTRIPSQLPERSCVFMRRGVYPIRLLGTRSIEVREQPDVLAALPSQASALV